MTTEAAMLRISAKHRNMAARLRPARTPVIRREASPIAEDISINREHGACCSCVAKHADLTDKTKLVRDPDAGLRGLLSRIALVAPNPAIIPLRSSGGDSE